MVTNDLINRQEKKGKWIDERGVEYCSVCGKTPDIWCSFDVSDWKYCPHCGARMEESEESDGKI